MKSAVSNAYYNVCIIDCFYVVQDISDLFGADLPVESKKKIAFKWRDGPFLKALKNGDWILLDEVSSCVDHTLNSLNQKVLQYILTQSINIKYT